MFLSRVYRHGWPPGHIWENIKKRALNRPSYTEHVFVLGSPRSGTTLLHKLISGNSGFCGCKGESGIFTLQNLMRPGRNYCGIDSELARKLLESTSSQVELFEAVASSACPSEEMVFVEKTPGHVFSLCRLVKLFPNSWFINIYRDGRDCYCSSKSNKYVIQNRSIEYFARYWKKSIKARSRVSSERIIDMHYEKLVGNPEETLQDVMSVMGHSFEPEQLLFWKKSVDPKAETEAFKKLSKPIDNASVGRWKSELTEAENNRFIDIAGKELKMLGYM